MRQEIKSLQGLRAIAVLMIFFSHCQFSFSTANGGFFGVLGGLGVSIFMMLSGYLAMYQYADTDLPKAWELLKHKLWKFYPLHLATLIIALPFAYKQLFVDMKIKVWGSLVLNATLLQTWLPKGYFSFNGVSWYLSVTVFFIVCIPFVVQFLRDKNCNSMWLMFGLIFLFEISLAVGCNSWKYAHWIVYVFPFTRLCEFVTGGAYM